MKTFYINEKKNIFIVARIKGGIGNQMFIYAVSKALSIDLNIPLKLDIHSGYLNDKFGRKYLLEFFKINDEIYKSNILLNYHTTLLLKIDFLLQLLFKIGSFIYIKERKNYFHNFMTCLKSNKNIYLDGYWQSPQYFEKHSAIIRRIFNFEKINKESISTYIELITKSNSTSIHFRSYSEVKNNTESNVLKAEYYYKAIDRINEITKNTLFFIFSDNIEFVKENFNIPHNSIIIECNLILLNDAPFYEMYLMSLCKNNIISNSTFSWWAAYLNVNNEKNVLVPQEPFNNTNIYPLDWIRI